MADGIPVKKRWKIDFSSKCNKSVVSFSKTPEAKMKEGVNFERINDTGGEDSYEPSPAENSEQPETFDPPASEKSNVHASERRIIHDGDANGITSKALSNLKAIAAVKTEVQPMECPVQSSNISTDGKLVKPKCSTSPEPPKDPAPKGNPRKYTKKKKVMVTIQNYSSDSGEEPVQKARPQRRSKPSMMDLRDQHRVFNATSFLKEKQPLDGEEGHNSEPRVEMATTMSSDASPPLIAVPLQTQAPAGPVLGRLFGSSSDDTEDGLPLSQYVPKKPVVIEKEKSPEDKVLKKVKKKKLKKKKKDPQEPQKPVSAYALFFRDMQSSIKAEHPEASFGEISKIVANQWDALDDSKKTNYKKKMETAKKEYLKKLAAYKANRISAEAISERTSSEPTKVVSQPLQTNLQSAAPTFTPAAPISGPQLYESSQRPEPPVMFTALNAPPGEYESGPHIPAPASILPSKPGICVNEGCTNLAIEDARWDREYCSTECVVQHCREAFQSWVLHRQDCSTEVPAASIIY